MKPIRIIHLENDPYDVELVKSILVENGLVCDITAVETEDDFVAAVARENPDLILADYSLPVFDGMSALELARKEWPEIPFILVSGSIGEEFAIESLRRGATDYVLKTNLKRLLPAITRALNERHELLRRREAEAAILRLKAAIEHSSDNIIITGKDGTIEYVNPAFEENTGYLLDELVGKTPSIMKSGIHDREFYDDLWQTITVGQTWRGVMVNRKKDGTLYTEESTISPILTTDDEISGFVAIKRDITETLEFESRRHRKQLLLRRLADVFLTFADDRMYGKALELILENFQSRDGLFGYLDVNRDLIIPSMTGDIWDRCRVGDRSRAFTHREIPPSWSRAIEAQKGFFVNEPVRVPEGHLEIPNVMVMPLTFQDHAVGLLVIANRRSGYSEDDYALLAGLADYISPILHARLERLRQEEMRREAEKKLQEYSWKLKQMVDERTQDLKKALIEAEKRREWLDAVIRSFAGGLLVTDINGKVKLMNRYAEIFLNVSYGNIRGKPLEDLFADGEIWRRIKKEFSGGDMHAFEFPLPDTKTGKKRILRARVAGIYNRDNERTANVTVLDDITHEREIEKLKTDFISVAAHQFRTPLTSIQGFSEILLTENDISPDEHVKFLTYINKQSMKLATLISDLLDLSRIEAETVFDLDARECRAAGLINDLLPSLRQSYPNHEFRVDALEQPDTIMVDREKIEQVLQNLLDNAAKFSPLGGRINIRGENRDGLYRISVEDEGIGMTPEQAGRIFDKFYRVDTSDSAAIGTGLGMSIIKHIVEKHGGEVEVKSNLGEGTTVFFTVPASKKQGEGA